MELTQKGEMVSRLQAKAGQIGKILNNLEKYNHLLKDDKKPMDKKTLSEKKHPIPKFKKDDKKQQKQTPADSEMSEQELKEPIPSDSTESFIKLDFELGSPDQKE